MFFFYGDIYRECNRSGLSLMKVFLSEMYFELRGKCSFKLESLIFQMNMLSQLKYIFKFQNKIFF